MVVKLRAKIRVQLRSRLSAASEKLGGGWEKEGSERRTTRGCSREVREFSAWGPAGLGI